MIRVFLASLLLILSAPAFAQAWGPDGEQTPVWPQIDDVDDANEVYNYTLPVLGDGSNAWGGTAPAMALQPAQIPFPTTLTDGLTSGGSTTGFDENKFRMTCFGDRAILASKDPIKLKGQRRAGHLHYFWGALTIDENSDYTSLRQRAGEINPTCPGQGLWNTGYWLPAIIHPNARGDGIARVKKINNITVYYVCKPDATPPTTCSNMPRGLAFIGGTDVDDPTDSGRIAEAVASSVGSTYAGYTILGNTPIRPKWSCITAGGTVTASAPYLKTSAGVDALGNCPSTSFIRLEIFMQRCWDGRNLTSPGGRGHVRYPLYPVGLGNYPMCPTGWYVLPEIELKFDFSHRGPSDYLQWYASSDASTTAATGVAMGAGESVHVDWMNGMDQRVADDWQRYCAATQDSADFIGACNDNTINADLDRLDPTGAGSYGPFVGDNDNDWISIPERGIEQAYANESNVMMMILALLFAAPVAAQEPPGVDLDMALMYHKPVAEQEKEYRKKMVAAVTALQASPAKQIDKQVIYETINNAIKQAKAKDYEGAMALIAAADKAIKKLP